VRKSSTGVEAAHRRVQADRPTPAIPLLLLALVVLGAIALTFIEANQSGFYIEDPARVAYWAVASAVAYLVMVLVARRQGYRRGIWVDRSPLAAAGLLALVIALIVVLGQFAMGDLLIRGNVPVLALTVGVLVWAYHERRPGLWVIALALIPLSLLANLYDMENLLGRMGIPGFAHADQVANLGAIAIVLLIGAAGFALAHGFVVIRARRSR
jgi:hypothetical protein